MNVVHSIPKKILRGLGRPAVVSSVVALGWRVSKEAARFSAGEIPAEEFKARVGGHVGSVALGSSAAVLSGAAVGSVLPGVGTALGALVGGLVGDVIGKAAGRGAVRWAQQDPHPQPRRRREL